MRKIKRKQLNKWSSELIMLITILKLIYTTTKTTTKASMSTVFFFLWREEGKGWKKLNVKTVLWALLLKGNSRWKDQNTWHAQGFLGGNKEQLKNKSTRHKILKIKYYIENQYIKELILAKQNYQFIFLTALWHCELLKVHFLIMKSVFLAFEK